MKSSKSNQQSRLKLSDLIKAGIIKPPLTIYGTYHRKDFTAQIDKDGFVILDGKRFTSLSIAAGVIRASISGPPSDGLSYRRANGWTFWHYKDSGGDLISIDDLRK